MDLGPCEVIKIYGPLERSDLPGLYARVCGLLAKAPGSVVVWDVGGISPDAVAVEALCRLKLGARHHGRDVRLRNARPGLLAVAAFMGLGGVIAPELCAEV